jgi:hypothetical protein
MSHTINVIGVKRTYESFGAALADFDAVTTDDFATEHNRIDSFILANPFWTSAQIAEKFGLERIVIDTMHNGIKKVIYAAYGETFIGPCYE